MKRNRSTPVEEDLITSNLQLKGRDRLGMSLCLCDVDNQQGACHLLKGVLTLWNKRLYLGYLGMADGKMFAILQMTQYYIWL